MSDKEKYKVLKQFFKFENITKENVSILKNAILIMVSEIDQLEHEILYDEVNNG